MELVDMDDTTISSSILLHDQEMNPPSQTEVSELIPDDQYSGGVYASLSGGMSYQKTDV